MTNLTTPTRGADEKDDDGAVAAIIAEMQGIRNDLQHQQMVVGKKVFGQTVVDYSGKKMKGYIGRSEDRETAGYGW